MTYKDELLKTHKDISHIYFEFLLYKDKNNTFFYFVEGDEDRTFYSQFVLKKITKLNNYKCFIAGDKSSVLKTLQNFINYRSAYISNSIFIVDRDFDFWLNRLVEHPNLFYTIGYSVENYIISDYIVCEYLSDFYHAARCSSDELNYSMEQFKLLYEDFCHQMRLYMAIALYIRKNQLQLDLNDFNFINYMEFEYENENIKLVFNHAELLDNTLTQFELDKESLTEINQIDSLFEQNQRHYFVRGKWSIHFLWYYCNYLGSNASIFFPSTGREKLKKRVQISKDALFITLAPKLANFLPNDISSFLESVNFRL